MKKLIEITLGIVTSVGGFLEVGSIATAAQAGAAFGFQLTWAIVLGTICLIFLVEMSGRLAAVSGHTVAGAMRERFGFPLLLVLLATVTAVTVMVMASEIGGVCLALQFATGITFRWWAVPVAALTWLLLWKGTFGVIEKGTSLLGLVAVSFLVGALMLHPSWRAVGASVIPTRPTHDPARYWFIAVSIIGATIAPYLLYFYSSGAVEDEWDESHLPVNKAVSALGMSFGAVLSVAVLLLSAMTFHPKGIQIESFDQVALILTGIMGRWGFILFVVALGVACLGAALEIALSLAYLVAQAFGWNWSENARPTDAPRFALMYTAALLVAALPIAAGVDPLKLTILSMALTAASLPLAIGPFLVLMNDERYVGDHGNSWLGNTVVGLITALAFVLAIVSIPLEILGS